MISFDSTLTDEQITEIIVNRFKHSKTISDMKLANLYMNNFNVEINNKERVYYDKDRKPINNPSASNVKLSSKFLRNLVQQKQDYGFSKTFIIKVSDENETELDFKTNEYAKSWKELCDGELFKLSYNLAGNAINNGIAFAYVYINEDGKLKLQLIPSELVYPIWCDKQHTILDKLVYNYSIEVYRSMNSDKIEYAKYYDSEKNELFCVTNGYQKENVEYDKDGMPITSHMINNGTQISWGKIPFIFLKGNDDELTLLSFIKEQIDAYDLLDSMSVDSLADSLDPLLIFKGISPDVRDLIEARELAKMTKTMSLDTDGDAYYIKEDVDISNFQHKLESLRRDIIKFGYGVDYENVKFSGNPNQMMVKSLYQNLDTYIDGIERQFQTTIENLKYFFDKWYEMTGKGTFEEIQKYKVLVKLDRSMMINVSEMIDNTIKLQNTGISKKTLLEYNPIIQDINVEQERLNEEKEEERQENNLFNFDMEEKDE